MILGKGHNWYSLSDFLKAFKFLSSQKFFLLIKSSLGL